MPIYFLQSIKGVPFRRLESTAPHPLRKGAPFYNAFVKRKHTSLDARFLRSAQYRCYGTTSSHMCLSAVVPAVAEPDIHSLYRARRPSQKIEFVFSASPETIRGSLGRLLSFAQSATCGTWRPARCINSFFCRPCGGSKLLPGSDLLWQRSPVWPDPRLPNRPPSFGLQPGWLD